VSLRTLIIIRKFPCLDDVCKTYISCDNWYISASCTLLFRWRSKNIYYCDNYSVHPETKGSNLSMLRKKCKQISETMYISDFLLIFAYMRVVTGSPFWTIPHRGGPESHKNCQIRAFQTTEIWFLKNLIKKYWFERKLEYFEKTLNFFSGFFADFWIYERT